jgi:hypothetical protein
VNEYKENFKFEDGILHVHLSGKFPNEMLREQKNLFQPLIDACSTSKCKKALIDARDLEVEFGIMALFQAGEDAASLARIGLHVALLAREDMLNTFFDNVVFNRGGDVGIFTDMDAALEWLQSEP